jgi:hypothetical protein
MHSMFGKMNVVPILDLQQAPDEAGASLETAIARLLDLTEHPTIAKWVQFPKALFVFLVVPGDPESGALYVFDRSKRLWYWVDFEDEKFGGYTVGDFDQLVRECQFLDIVERPHLLRSQIAWVIQPGLRPCEDRPVAAGGAVSEQPTIHSKATREEGPPEDRAQRGTEISVG